MKKIICFAIFLSFAFVNGFSQTRIAVNPVAGVNFSTLINEPSGFTSKGALGWQFGGNLRIGNQIFFQPGLQIAQFSSELTRDDFNFLNEDTFKTDLTILRIPLLAGVQFLDTGTKDAFNWDMHAGLAVDVVIGATGLLGTEDVNSTMFSAVIGAGIDIASFTLALDYELGLSKYFKDGGNLSGDTRQNTFLISIGWKTVL